MRENRGLRGSALGTLIALAFLSAACSGAHASKASSPPPPSPAATGAASPTPGAAIGPTPTSSATPVEGFILGQFDVAQPQGFVAAFGSMWVPGHHDGTITRIDAQTNQVVAVIQGVGYQAQDVTAGDGSVWVPASGADYIARIDPESNRVTSRLKVGAVSDVEFGFGSLWAATKDMRLLRVDPGSERVVATFQVGPKVSNECNNGPAITAKWVWVTVCDTGMLVQVDPRSNKIVRQLHISSEFGSPNGGGAVASGDQLWDVFPGAVARLDPDTGKILLQAPLGAEQAGGGFMAVDHGTLWLGGRGILTAFDAKTLRVLATYEVTGPGGEVIPSVGFGSVWVEVYELSQVTRFAFPAAG